MNQINSVCVYSASSTKIDEVYFNAARQLGQLLAKRRIRLINGAGSIGLMRSVADAVLENVKAGTTVEIYSADGQCLKSIVYSAPIQTGDLSGVCILKIYNGDTVICKKIVL